jgi:hypothetical protein
MDSMKLLLSLAIGIYAALGPLCPMQLAAASATMDEGPMMSMESSVHDTHAHDTDLQCVAFEYASSCGDSEHCQLADTVDSAGVVAAQEVPATCFAGVMTIPIDMVAHAEDYSIVSMDRPPPLAVLATVVLRQ